MIYREVASSSVLPLSAVDTSFSFSSLEKLFDNYFYSKGQKYYNIYKSSLIQSNTTFLKDLFNNINNQTKEGQIDDRQKMLLNLFINTIQNQLKAIEELFSDTDIEALNAIICGTTHKHIKKYFS